MFYLLKSEQDERLFVAYSSILLVHFELELSKYKEAIADVDADAEIEDFAEREARRRSLNAQYTAKIGFRLEQFEFFYEHFARQHATPVCEDAHLAAASRSFPARSTRLTN